MKQDEIDLITSLPFQASPGSDRELRRLSRYLEKLSISKHVWVTQVKCLS